jgi:BirA family biotin operon repressor/biotin-[acetyl-CoA-carboxylase] ligase
MAAALRQRLIDAAPGPFGRVDWVEQTGSTNADLLARARYRADSGNGGKPVTAAQDRNSDGSGYRAIATSTEAALAHRPGGDPKPWLLGAHLQQTGRGRAGRAWQNRPGAALMFSCAFDTTLPPSSLPVLSPLAGLAACEALRAIAGQGGERLRVKWPNDVQWGDAKLAGVLVETTRNLGARPASHTVVIGMGLNLRDADVLSRELDRDIADWTTTGCGMALSDVVREVALAWRDALMDVERGGFAAFVERFRRLDALAGRDIRVLDRGAVVHRGVGCGADAQGRLLVRTEAGEVPVSVGEISVRPA